MKSQLEQNCEILQYISDFIEHNANDLTNVIDENSSTINRAYNLYLKLMTLNDEIVSLRDDLQRTNYV